MDGDMAENTKTADYIFDGKIMIDTLYDDLITSTINVARVNQKIQRATSNFKIVQIIDKVFVHQKLQVALESLDNVLKKDDIVAEILKKKTRTCDLDKEKVFRCYNLALLTSTKSGQQIGMIYSERALLFRTLKDEKSCLEDILLALKCNISLCLREMLSTLAERIMNSIIIPLNLEGQTLDFIPISSKTVYCDDIMFHIYGTPNPKIPVTTDYIEVKYKNEKGRYLISNKGLKPGTTIIVEDPYVSVLNESLNWDTEHCGRCYKKSIRLIPCPNCIFVMYCDDKCCNEDYENGHRYECPCFSFLHGLRMIKSLRLSFKAICKAGPIELYKLFIASNNNNDYDLNTSMNIGDKKGFNPETGIYDSNSYFQICNLADYNARRDVPILACASMILVYVLNLKSNFFDTIEQQYNNKFIIFTASHILRHGTSFPINSFGLCENIEFKNWETSLNDYIDPDKDTEPIITTLYPFISLISHSCCPNSVCHTLTNGKMCVITNMEIKPNEEITISYGYWYWTQDLNYRRHMLWKYYNFICFCPACSCKWPILKDLTDTIKYHCPLCTNKIHYNELVRTKKYILNKITGNTQSYGICNKCKNEIEMTNIMKETKQHYKNYDKACSLIYSKNEPLEALPILIQCIQYFQLHISPPSKAFLAATDQLEKIQRLFVHKYSNE